MDTPRKKRSFREFITRINEQRYRNIKRRLTFKKRVAELKVNMQKDSHSLLWVWEFSKKAVLLCFIFYVIVQIYAMAVMVISCDYTYLGELINQTGEILQNCVFAYLIKAGFENVGKIWLNHDRESNDESVG